MLGECKGKKYLAHQYGGTADNVTIRLLVQILFAQFKPTASLTVSKCVDTLFGRLAGQISRRKCGLPC
jgi:hypothetical protein